VTVIACPSFPCERSLGDYPYFPRESLFQSLHTDHSSA
jgi:hypothetical protein